jgi:DNA-binding MarR family transcriptional regulator
MASRKVSHLYDVALAPVGLKGTQFSLLAEVARREHEPPRMKDLAETLVMDRSTLGQNAQPLQRDGFIVLIRDEEDGRSRQVHLTEKGRSILVEGLRLWEEVQVRIEKALGHVESRELRNMLMALVENEKLDYETR